MGSEEFSPFFFVSRFSSLFRFFSYFFHFSSVFSYCPRGKGQTTAIYCKNGEFHSDPVCTDPVRNFPKCCGEKRVVSGNTASGNLDVLFVLGNFGSGGKQEHGRGLWSDVFL